MLVIPLASLTIGVDVFVNVSCHNINVIRYLLCIKVCNGEVFIRVNSVQDCTNFRSLYGLNFSL